MSILKQSLYDDPVVDAPPSLLDIAKRVDARIDEVLRSEVSRWADLDEVIAEPLQILRQLVLAGGKRLRPAFCHWAFVGAGGDPEDPRIVDAGAALEMLHTFALVHDDIMDGSDRRRGLPAVHRHFEERHATQSWRGEQRRFGEGVAILVGDLAFVYADLLLAEAPRAAVDVFTELRLEVNIGQYLDLLGTVSGDATPASARRICRYKSGKYTVERPLHMGAAIAGRLAELAAPLTAYGDPLGEAFQLRDDLLGAFGDVDKTGKPVGEDLREGKPTALFALARQTATGPAGEVLRSRYGANDLTGAEVAEVQEIFESTGARAAVEAQVDALVAQALDGLAVAPITSVARDELEALARFVAARDF